MTLENFCGKNESKMKTIDQIPEGKLRRAGKILKTGLKVGRNYASYIGDRIVNSDDSKEKLDLRNATDIMNSLQELKGGGLKMAQMLSMESGLLPKAYVEQFSLSQFSVPPLSAPLVKKTFRTYFGKSPEEVFDSFDYNSYHAASIGQVHQAWLNEQKLAVKIQYPGVGKSIQSDLSLLKPMASRLLKLKGKEADKYFGEVESKLIEETDYLLELQNSMDLTKLCAGFQDIVFPNYYPELSNERILTMDWLDGEHISQYVRRDISQETRDHLGQTLWNFYLFQIHNLQKVHADPHPGNIIITEDQKIGIIDFGCIKELPAEFFNPYSRLLEPGILNDRNTLEEVFEQLEILYPDDSKEVRTYYFELFEELLHLAMKPFIKGVFDFSDPVFFKEFSQTGEKLMKESLMSDLKPNRGSRHFIYVNRTFFGLYHLLHLLKATVDTHEFLAQAA